MVRGSVLLEVEFTLSVAMMGVSGKISKKTICKLLIIKNKKMKENKLSKKFCILQRFCPEGDENGKLCSLFKLKYKRSVLWKL